MYAAEAYQFAISFLPSGLIWKCSKAALYATLCRSSDSRMTPGTSGVQHVKWQYAAGKPNTHITVNLKDLRGLRTITVEYESFKMLLCCFHCCGPAWPQHLLVTLGIYIRAPRHA